MFVWRSLDQCYQVGAVITISYKAVGFPFHAVADVGVCGATECKIVDKAKLKSGRFSIKADASRFPPDESYVIKFLVRSSAGYDVILVTGSFFVATDCESCTSFELER